MFTSSLNNDLNLRCADLFLISERYSLSDVSWVFCRASSQCDIPKTPLLGEHPKTSETCPGHQRWLLSTEWSNSSNLSSSWVFQLLTLSCTAILPWPIVSTNLSFWSLPKRWQQRGKYWTIDWLNSFFTTIVRYTKPIIFHLFFTCEQDPEML